MFFMIQKFNNKNQNVKIYVNSLQKKKLKSLVQYIANLSWNYSAVHCNTFFLKKRPFKNFTVLSSPHVYKKSRKQYIIYKYKAFINLTFKNEESLVKIFDLRAKLFENRLSQGIIMNFQIIKRKKIKLLSY